MFARGTAKERRLSQLTEDEYLLRLSHEIIKDSELSSPSPKDVIRICRQPDKEPVAALGEGIRLYANLAKGLEDVRAVEGDKLFVLTMYGGFLKNMTREASRLIAEFGFDPIQDDFFELGHTWSSIVEYCGFAGCYTSFQLSLAIVHAVVKATEGCKLEAERYERAADAIIRVHAEEMPAISFKTAERFSGHPTHLSILLATYVEPRLVLDRSTKCALDAEGNLKSKPFLRSEILTSIMCRLSEGTFSDLPSLPNQVAYEFYKQYATVAELRYQQLRKAGQKRGEKVYRNAVVDPDEIDVICISPEEEVLAKERAEELSATIDHLLSPGEAAILEYMGSGWSSAEIGANVGISANNVDARIKSIRKKLGRALNVNPSEYKRQRATRK
jgi:hypothetical protein